MRRPTMSLLIAATAAISGAPVSAQILHTNDRWDECAFVLDPSLSQQAWHQFIGEVGLVMYFRPLTSAEPMGAGRFEIAVLQWSTKIDDADAAWNDTFSHPSADHYLFEGAALPIPGLMLRAGVSDRIDVGAYFTKNVNANYGIAGGQVQYSFLDDETSPLSAAARLNAVRLFGPEDLSASVYGLDFVVSRDVSIFSPYASVSGFLSRGQEHTSKVDLDTENVFGAQAVVGVAANVWALRLGAEYSFARVSGYAFKVAFGT